MVVPYSNHGTIYPETQFVKLIRPLYSCETGSAAANIGLRATEAHCDMRRQNSNSPSKTWRSLALLSREILGGSCVDISRVISRVTILRTHIRVLIPLLITTPEPPSTSSASRPSLHRHPAADKRPVSHSSFIRACSPKP